MQSELDVHFPNVIVNIISFYLSKFKGVISNFPYKNTLNRIIIKNDKIYSYDHYRVNVYDLKGNLVSEMLFSEIDHIQLLKDGNLLIISSIGEFFLYDTTMKEIINKVLPRYTSLYRLNSYYSFLHTESNYYYFVTEYTDCTKISRIDPYSKENSLEISLNVTRFKFSITEYKDSFYVNSNRIIYYITGNEVKEIPIYGKLVTDIGITKDGLLYYVSSTEINYLLISHDIKNGIRKTVTLLIEINLRIHREINLISNKIFLKTSNPPIYNRTLSVLDIETGEIIYSKEGDELNLVGIISGHLVYTHVHDELYVNFIKFSTGDLVSSYNLDKNIYIGKTSSEELLFLGNNKITIFS